MTGPAPIWFLDRSTTFFAGTLDYNAPHQHGAPVFLIGIDGSFGLRLHGTPWLTCRTAMIPAGVVHELDVGGQPIAVLYLEGEDGSVFSALIGSSWEIGGALLGSNADALPFRMLFEDADSDPRIGEGLRDLLAFVRAESNRIGRYRPTDGRLQNALDLLSRMGSPDPEAPSEMIDTSAVAKFADRAGLSQSRFQHLFTAQMGVPFRRYRSWVRLRQAIGEIVTGANFTTAAHAAGYADQAHFAHDFRRTFGAPASRSLKGLRRDHHVFALASPPS